MDIEKGIAKNIEFIAYHDLNKIAPFQMAMQVVEDNWYLYLASYKDSGWTILNVTDPTHPIDYKFIPGPGGEGTSTPKIQVANGIMVTTIQLRPYFKVRPDDPFVEGIYIWDVKDPMHPKRLGYWKTGAIGPHRFYYDGGRYVHLSASCPGFGLDDPTHSMIYRIVDIGDPTKPVEVGRWWLPEQWSAGGPTMPEQWSIGGASVSVANMLAHGPTHPGLHGPPYPKGDKVYCSYGVAGMVILDIEDIKLPKFVGQLKVSPPMSASVHTVMPLSRRPLAVISSEGGPPQPKEREFGKERKTSPLDIAGIVDISDPENPTLISLFPVPEPPPGAPYKNFHEKGRRFGPHNWHEPHNHPDLEDRNDRLYLCYFNAGLRVYDISDPFMPREIAYFIPPDPEEILGKGTGSNSPWNGQVTSVEDVLVDKRGFIYAADTMQGLFILRCTV
jgi:hypothetical protein